MRVPTMTQFTNQLQTITQQNLTISSLQQQISSQKKIQNASDDPVLASQIKSINDYISSLQSYTNNGVLAQNRSSLFETSLQSCVNVMSKVTELSQAGKTETLSNADRANLASQLSGSLSRLLNVANTTDGNGEAIFAGYNTSSPAFVQKSGSYQYQGGLDQVNISIGPNTTTVYNDSGFNLFGNIATGNGAFTVKAGLTNTGTAYTSPGSVVSNASYVPDTYTISFVTNGSGQLGYQVTGANSGQVIPTPPATSPANAPAYVAGSDLTFNGISLNVNGAPNSGDTMTIAPSSKDNIFNLIQNVINVLNKPVDSSQDIASFRQNMSQACSALASGSQNFRSRLSDSGVRAASLQTELDQNTENVKQQNIILGSLSDIDPYEVISKFTQQTQALQLTQQVYMKIQQSLSEFLKMT